jgi:hypothetical protein
VINIFIHTLFRWQRRKAKRLFHLDSISLAHPGAVTAIQRSGSAVNLNWHLHSLAFDGVFVQNDANAPPRFRALPAPTKGEVQSLAWEICKRTTEMLQKQGRYLDADPAESDSLAQDEPLLAASYAASLQQVVAIGDRAGERVERRRTLLDSSQRAAKSELVAGHGFDLHAQVRVPARDRKRLERLARYILRPAIAYERLSGTTDGKVIYELKKTWSDGTRALVFDSRDFLSKLVALIPRPRSNTIRYHGILAPAARLRGAVVPKPEGDRHGQSGPVQLGLDIERGRTSKIASGTAGQPQAGSQPHVESGGQSQGRKPTPFAELMAHTFDIDPNCCPRCQRGKMRLVRVVTDPASIARLMASLGSQQPSPEAPMASSAPTRAPPCPEQLLLPLADVPDAAADRRAA